MICFDVFYTGSDGICKNSQMQNFAAICELKLDMLRSDWNKWIKKFINFLIYAGHLVSAGCHDLFGVFLYV